MKYKTLPQSIDITQLKAAIYQPRTHQPLAPRSGGLHLTEILQRAARGNIKPEPRIVFGRNIFDPINEEDLPICMYVGMAWEDALLRLRKRMLKVGELSKDGVAMSPDAITYKSSEHLLSPGAPVDIVDEIKCTWKSSNNSVESYTRWLEQIKGYCHAANTRFARLHVLHVNGNYKFGNDPGGGPHYLEHHIEFTQFELLTNWQYVLRHK